MVVEVLVPGRCSDGCKCCNRTFPRQQCVWTKRTILHQHRFGVFRSDSIPCHPRLRFDRGGWRKGLEVKMNDNDSQPPVSLSLSLPSSSFVPHVVSLHVPRNVSVVPFFLSLATASCGVIALQIVPSSNTSRRRLQRHHQHYHENRGEDDDEVSSNRRSCFVVVATCYCCGILWLWLLFVVVICGCCWIGCDGQFRVFFSGFCLFLICRCIFLLSCFPAFGHAIFSLVHYAYDPSLGYCMYSTVQTYGTVDDALRMHSSFREIFFGTCVTNDTE